MTKKSGVVDKSGSDYVKVDDEDEDDCFKLA